MLVEVSDAPKALHHCPRCHTAVYQRIPDSLARTWAFLLAAMALYIPANLYPILTLVSFGQKNSDTIISGVFSLMGAGQWSIALIVFVASVLVPIVKIVVLLFLVLSVQLKIQWRPDVRTRMYRVTELVGRWSMVDIFMISILIALVKLQALANVDAGPGAAAFAAVVILTMLAAMSFDPRLIWDVLEEETNE
ncbi:paraquat-inducible protein [Sneathiella chinensis]|uniref:Paraquat-inducible protein n=1 Tax=Sneathiella chinensis TaxID=349750 RepID=A0ABQ5U5B6_9PROT|nr:paraquat-inducible protein [Sneathiella chinensis]